MAIFRQICDEIGGVSRVHARTDMRIDLAFKTAIVTGSAGVTVNAILPGPTLSEGVREMLRGPRRKPAGRSPLSSATTGAAFRVDGGVVETIA